MDVPILFAFGICFVVVALSISKPERIISKNNIWQLYGGCFPVNAMTRYFPLLLFIFTVFICLAAFQNVYGGIYDLPNYKSFFDDSKNYASLSDFLHAYDKEFFYMTLTWIFGRITNSFSVLLLFFFSFIFYSIVRFFKVSHINPSGMLYTAVFCLVFTIVFQSYCLLRTGLSVAAGLMSFSEMQIKSSRESKKFFQNIKILFWAVVAVGFHSLGLFVFSVIVMHWIYRKKDLKTFMFFFVLFFSAGYVGATIIKNMISSFYMRFVLYAGLDANPAYKTYVANIFLVATIFYKKRCFFQKKENAVHFVILMCSFFIYDLELAMTSIMFRMIYFTRPSTAIIIAELWKIYAPKKTEIIVPLLIRLLLIIYVFYNFYGFVISMPRYGLNFYDFGYVY
ncbi:MAG: hypothetical protein HDR52_06395 [Treponema sp.]|nr:hypothetical protein [Treponema sp.]